MSLNLQFEFHLGQEPLIDVTLVNPETSLFDWAEALIDTGADLTVFDEQIAARLGIQLQGEVIRLGGVGGGTIQARRAIVTLQLLGEPSLALTLPVCFAPDMEDGPRNLIGLDILQSIDFAISLASHAGYVGLAAGAAV